MQPSVGPNSKLLALFNIPALAQEDSAQVQQTHDAPVVLGANEGNKGSPLIVLKPSVKKFLEYAEMGNSTGILDHYPPYGMPVLMPAAQTVVVNQPRLRTGRYKDDSFARCATTAEAVHGEGTARKLCFRCKSTETVCMGAVHCCFGAEVFLATSAKPCGLGCGLPMIPKVASAARMLTAPQAAIHDIRRLPFIGR
jgi:hypothetical protein